MPSGIRTISVSSFQCDFDYLPAKVIIKNPASFYGLSFRIARFQISEDTYETVLTNLDKEQYPLEKLKQLYALRWGIETSFSRLKYYYWNVGFSFKKGDVYPTGNLCTSNHV